MTIRKHTGAAMRGAVVAMTALGLAGCQVDDLVEVNTPDIVQPESVSSASALPAVLAAAIGEFNVAYQGSSGTEGQILYSGLLGDEIKLSDTFETRRQIDRRSILIDNSNNDAVYRQLHRARTFAENAVDNYARLSPNVTGQAEAMNLAGFAYVFFGENYCSGVPFSRIAPDGATEYGSPLTTQQMFARALQKFDSALTIATTAGSAAQQNLARVGRGRVLLNLGRYADAAAAVENVPLTFSYVTFSTDNTARQRNGVWDFNINQRRFSVADQEGTNGLPYRSDNDPRVPWVRPTGGAGNGFDNTPLFAALKYPTFGAQTVVANGVEAQLIRAEAAFQTTGYDAALTILNTLRANTALYPCPTGVTFTNFTCNTTALTPLVDPGTRDAQIRQLFKERAYWLYLTSHRVGDMRRLSRATTVTGLSAYGLGAENVYPVGAWSAAENYSTQTSLPVSQFEQNNPNFQSCNNVTP